MYFLNRNQFKALLIKVQGPSSSLRRRFLIYMSSLLCTFLFLILILLNIFGVLNPSRLLLEKTLNYQLDTSATYMQTHTDELAAFATKLSTQMKELLDTTLLRNRITFDELKNNAEILSELQAASYNTIYSNMQIVPCSGAFYFLNTTVNDQLPDTYYNGVYLKFMNIYAENTIYNRASVFRGVSTIAREHDIKLHSTWRYELQKGTFSELDWLLESSDKHSSHEFYLSSVYKLPDSWENVLLLYVPITDDNGNVLGVCGFEISNLYFSYCHQTTDSEWDYLIFALLTETENGYSAQIAGNNSGYTPPVNGIFQIEEGAPLSVLTCQESEFVGKTRELHIGNTHHIAVAMLPKEQYQQNIRHGQLVISLILFLLILLASLSCWWLSKRYVTPILKSFEQIKSQDVSPMQCNIVEIDDLFRYLEEKDKTQEEQIQQLSQQNQNVLQEYAKAQLQIDHLADERKQEIDPDSYQIFLNSIHTLTPKEYEIFNYYLEGKSAKEILAIANITENTLKYHNKNIYSKFGISSRKQLLQYAAIMKSEQQKK